MNLHKLIARAGTDKNREENLKEGIHDHYLQHSDFSDCILGVNFFTLNKDGKWSVFCLTTVFLVLLQD